jgi:hypothetical protein
MAPVVTRNIVRDEVVTAGNKTKVNIILHHPTLANGVCKSKISISKSRECQLSAEASYDNHEHTSRRAEDQHLI